MSRAKQIVTSFVNPPIPVRTLDWVAYYDGQEEGFCGYGETEEDAIAELTDTQPQDASEPTSP